MVKDDHNYSTMKLVDNQELQLHLLSKEIHGWNVSHLGYTKVSIHIVFVCTVVPCMYHTVYFHNDFYTRRLPTADL